MKRRLLLVLTASCALVAAVVLAMSGPAVAKDEKTMEFLACSGFLAEAFPEVDCISREHNGDTFESEGRGTFSVRADGSGKVEGRGTFIHRSPQGVVIGRGTWKAKEFLAYRSYGCAGCPPDLPAGSEGGNLLFRAEFDPAGEGPKFTGTIEINCALGNFPANRAYEALEPRLVGLRFDQNPQGVTLFIRQAERPDDDEDDEDDD
jgi:hypothetical protein